jgi:Tn3 transposase DDE domain
LGVAQDPQMESHMPQVALLGQWIRLLLTNQFVIMPVGDNLQAAFVELRQQGVNVTPTLVTHVAPLGWEHIGLTGDMSGLTPGSLLTVCFDRSGDGSRCSRPE